MYIHMYITNCYGCIVLLAQYIDMVIVRCTGRTFNVNPPPTRDRVTCFCGAVPSSSKGFKNPVSSIFDIYSPINAHEYPRKTAPPPFFSLHPKPLAPIPFPTRFAMPPWPLGTGHNLAPLYRRRTHSLLSPMRQLFPTEQTL
jgi:hypothetical protein